MWFLVIVMKDTDYATPKYATLAWGLLWAEGTWEETDTQKVPCTPSICLKAGYKFVKVSLFSLDQEGQKITTETTRDPYRLRDGTRRINIEVFAKTSPYLPLVFSHICLAIICWPKRSKSLSFVWQFCTKLLFFAKMPHKPKF